VARLACREAGFQTVSRLKIIIHPARAGFTLKMKRHLHHIVLVVKRLGIILLLFTLCRVLFYLFNTSYFSNISAIDLMIVFVHGIRFDISAILYCNLLFILLHVIPIPHREGMAYQKLLKVLFHITNAILLLANCADFEYFKFTFKRTTADIFNLIGLSSDFLRLLPQFMLDYWYVAFIWLVLILFAEFLYRMTDKTKPESEEGKMKRGILIESSLFLIFTGLFIIGTRGGLQLKPIGIINAGQYTHARNIPLALNTPFAIMTTLGKRELKEVNYFSDQELDNVYSPLQQFANFDSIRNPKPENILIIILESFSNEYIGALNKTGVGYTPFLDSLIGKSLVF